MPAYLLAQLPDAGLEDAISAASSRGWEAIMLVMVIVALFSGFTYILRWIMDGAQKREERLAARVTHLEDVIRTELFTALKANSEVMGKVLSATEAIIRAAERMTHALDKFTNILDVRPCLLPAAEQRKLLREFEDAAEPERKH
jgi:hypothetical protein